jgi:ABC-type lipoprotein export system ATPase subunit
MLSFEGLYKTFTSGDKQVEALENINLKIAPSEFAVSLSAPAGAEKARCCRSQPGWNIQPLAKPY